MSDRVRHALESLFGAAHVGLVRPRFDAAPVPLVAPTSVEGFRDALALARRERWVVRPTGLGSKLSWTPAGSRVDFLLSTWAYAGIEAYEPGDGTLTARAGTTLAELAAKAAAGGHALTPEVPRPGGSTLGGAIAAGQSGLDRLRHGPLRDHVLGLATMLSDGTLARCGGRLVKNVTGYDVQRLLAGSHGTLGVILEASLRLFPLPEDEALATLELESSTALVSASRAVLASELRPWALVADAARAPGTGAWTLCVRLAGRRDCVRAEGELLQRVLPGVELATGDTARRAWSARRDAAFGEIDGPRLSLSARSGRFATLLDIATAALATATGSGATAPRGQSAGAHDSAARWRCEPGLGSIEIALGARAHDPLELAGLRDSLRRALEPLGGGVRLLHAPSDVAPERAPTPAVPDAESTGARTTSRSAPADLLMRRLRERLDPSSTFHAVPGLP